MLEFNWMMGFTLVSCNYFSATLFSYDFTSFIPLFLFCGGIKNRLALWQKSYKSIYLFILEISPPALTISSIFLLYDAFQRWTRNRLYLWQYFTFFCKNITFIWSTNLDANIFFLCCYSYNYLVCFLLLKFI